LTTAVPSAEYVFGTHAAALVNAEAQKSKVWPSAKGGALPRVAAFVIAAPLFMDLSGSAANFQSSRAVLATTGKLGNFVSSVQVLPDQLQPAIQSPQFNPQGAIVGWQDASPDYLPNIDSQVWASKVGAVALTGKPPPYQSSGPALIDLSGSGYWSPPATNPQGRLQGFTNGAPQFTDLSGYAAITASAFNRQGPTLYQLNSAPPWMELILASWIQSAVPTPPVLIHGPTVSPLPQAYAAPDLTINYSATFTPSTFSPSAVINAIDTHDGLPKKHKRRYDDTVQTQVTRESQLRPKKAAKAPPAVVEAPKPLFVNAVVDTPEDEEALIQLMAKEDEQILAAIEEASKLLGKLS
jgi:hypothetical protein